MKRYIKPSTAKWMIEPDFVLDPESEFGAHDTSGVAPLTKGTDDWEEEADDFGW